MCFGFSIGPKFGNYVKKCNCFFVGSGYELLEHDLRTGALKLQNAKVTDVEILPEDHSASLSLLATASQAPVDLLTPHAAHKENKENKISIVRINSIPFLTPILHKLPLW